MGTDDGNPFTLLTKPGIEPPRRGLSANFWPRFFALRGSPVTRCQLTHRRKARRYCLRLTENSLGSRNEGGKIGAKPKFGRFMQGDLIRYWSIGVVSPRGQSPEVRGHRGQVTTFVAALTELPHQDVICQYLDYRDRRMIRQFASIPGRVRSDEDLSKFAWDGNDRISLVFRALPDGDGCGSYRGRDRVSKCVAIGNGVSPPN